jgi:outer membrane protein
MDTLSTIALACSAFVSTPTRSLSLAEAVDLAMRTEPLVAETRVARDRSELAVLRAELDRVTIKVDAQLQELWNESNIAGPALPRQCSAGAVSDAACALLNGQLREVEQSPAVGLGLSNVSASLTVPLFSGFRVEANVDRARHLEEASGQDIVRQRRDTSLAVARAYWAGRKIGLLVEVQERALAELGQAEQIAAARVRAGLSPPIDENRAHGRRLQQQAVLADLRGQLKEATEQLATALGIADGIVLEDPLQVPPIAPRPVKELIAIAAAGRSDLRAAASRLEAQGDAVRMARSGYYPQLAAFGLLQYGNNPYLAGVGSRAVLGSANPFSNPSGNLQLGLVLSINVFDTLNTYTSVEDARYEESLKREEWLRIARIVESDVRLARARVIHLRELFSRLVPARDIALDNLSILEKRYDNGEALVFELLDAEVELLNLERQITDTTAQLMLAWLELDASLGIIIGEKT